MLYTLVSNSTLGSLVGGGITPWIPGGMWNPWMDPKWDRWDPALDCRWEAAFALDPGWKAGSQVGPWAGLAGSRLGSQVRGGIPPWIPGGRWDPRLDPRWERPDSANGGGIQAIPPGIPGGIGGIPPESHLPFYLRSKLGV